MARQPLFLKIFRSGKLYCNKQFLSDQISIGSSQDGPSLVLSDPSVCYWHTLIERRGAEYYISDLGSPTGTFVNGKKILESPVRHGDQINIGNFSMQFFINVPFARPPDGANQKSSEVKSQPVAVGAVREAVRAGGDFSSEADASDVQAAAPVFRIDDEEAGPGISQPKILPLKPAQSAEPPSALPLEEELANEVSYQEADDTEEEESEEVLHDKSSQSEEEESEEVLHDKSSQSEEEESEEVIHDMSSQMEREESTEVLHDKSSQSEGEESEEVLHDKSSQSEEEESEEVLQDMLSLSAEELADDKSSSVRKEPAEFKEALTDESESISQIPTFFPLKESAPSAPSAPSTPSAPSKTARSRSSSAAAASRKPLLSRGTYAPVSTLKNLEKALPLGSGPIIEVITAWKERIIKVNHFHKAQEVSFGSDPQANICLPNMLGTPKYSLLEIKNNVSVKVSRGVKMFLFDGKHKYSLKDLTDKGLINGGHLVLQQKQLVRLDFGNTLSLYIRFSNRTQKAAPGSLFSFSVSETAGIMMSCFLMCILVFYIGLFFPQFLDPKEDLEEEGIKPVTIEFKKKIRPVRLKMAKRKAKKRAFSVPIKKAPKKRVTGIKKAGKSGRLAQAASKPKSKSKKQTITSARSGGAVNTKKKGAGPRAPRPDPTKVGLLAVFGSKGAQTVLDKAYSGTGELAGLADQATGFAGQKDSYTGDGIGTKFKNKGAGGRGVELIGASAGIKTKGRGGGGRGYGRGGSLGSRGVVQLEVGASNLSVAGGVDRNAILRIIRRYKHTMDSCISTARQKNPDISGRVFLNWEIINEKVRRVKVKSNTSGNAILARCIMEKVKRMRFTGTGLQPGQVGSISIPFTF